MVFLKVGEFWQKFYKLVFNWWKRYTLGTITPLLGWNILIQVRIFRAVLKELCRFESCIKCKININHFQGYSPLYSISVTVGILIAQDVEYLRCIIVEGRFYSRKLSMKSWLVELLTDSISQVLYPTCNMVGMVLFLISITLIGGRGTNV